MSVLLQCPSCSVSRVSCCVVVVVVLVRVLVLVLVLLLLLLLLFGVFWGPVAMLR